MAKAVEQAQQPPPLPRLRGLTGEWYGWLGQGELRFQRCACTRWRHPPRELCPVCGSSEWSWEPSTGRGVVYTWTTTHRPMHPAFVETPFAQVVVELEEGPRVVTSVVGLPVSDLRVGLAVEVVFDEVADDVTLARFRPRAAWPDCQHTY